MLGGVRAPGSGKQTRDVGVVAAGAARLLLHRGAPGVRRVGFGEEGEADVLRRVRHDERVEQRRRVQEPEEPTEQQERREVPELFTRRGDAETDAVATSPAGA